MRAAIIALMLIFGSQALAECGNLCDKEWWKTATDADVQAELDAGADVMARGNIGQTPLFMAAGIGKIRSVNLLLSVGADVMARTDDQGITPMHMAVIRPNSSELIRALFLAGSDLKSRTIGGVTPLHLAVTVDNLESTLTLLDIGADVNSLANGGISVLLTASSFSGPAIILTLLGAGADAKLSDELGHLPIDAAKENPKLKGTKAYWALNDAQYK